MLRRKYVPVADIEKPDAQLDDQRVVVQVKCEDDVKKLCVFVQNSTRRIGVHVSSSMITPELENLATHFSYVSVYLDRTEHIESVRSFVRKNSFVELIIPFTFINGDYGILDECSGSKRIVVDFTGFDTAHMRFNINALFAEFAVRKLFPFTKSLPFCVGALEHAVEFYVGCAGPQKPEFCNGCLFAKRCSYQGTEKIGKPYVDALKYKDAVRFMDNESSASRF